MCVAQSNAGTKSKRFVQNARETRKIKRSVEPPNCTNERGFKKKRLKLNDNGISYYYFFRLYPVQRFIDMQRLRFTFMVWAMRRTNTTKKRDTVLFSQFHFLSFLFCFPLIFVRAKCDTYNHTKSVIKAHKVIIFIKCYFHKAETDFTRVE